MYSNPSLSTEEFKQRLEKKLKSIFPSLASKRPTEPAPQSIQDTEFNAQLVLENIRIGQVVNVKDGRKRVLDPAKWPNCVHGVITWDENPLTNWGTGTLIGPNIVLTAGHNLYNQETKTSPDVKSLKFRPGVDGEDAPFGVIEVEKFFVSPRFIKEGKEDYAIMILKQPVGKMTGYFKLQCLEPEELKKKKINITGYPGDKVESKPKPYEMWGMEGEAARIDQGHIYYLIDTNEGQSGSGIWYKEGENYYVCGVHVTGIQYVNFGTLVTPAIYKQIQTWVQQVDSKESLFKLRNKKELHFKNLHLNTQCISLLTKYNLDDLITLFLVRTKMGNEEVKILAQNTSWKNLLYLNLSGNKIDAEGAKALAQNTSWIKLEHLNLSKNNIGAEGIKALAQNQAWKKDIEILT